MTREELAAKRERDEALYRIFRAIRDTPDPKSGVRVGMLDYAETVAFDAAVALMDADAAKAHALTEAADRVLRFLDGGIHPGLATWQVALETVTAELRALLPRATPYPEFCARAACRGLGSCPKDPTCAD